MIFLNVLVCLSSCCSIEKCQKTKIQKNVEEKGAVGYLYILLLRFILDVLVIKFCVLSFRYFCVYTHESCVRR